MALGIHKVRLLGNTMPSSTDSRKRDLIHPVCSNLKRMPSEGLTLFSRRKLQPNVRILGRILGRIENRTSNKCIASSNKCLTSSNKKLLGTSASLVVTSAKQCPKHWNPTESVL